VPAQAEALRARYGAAAAPPPGPWNDVIATLLAHRSVRAYRPDPLPPGTLESLIAAAQSAATSSNLQTWSVVAVTDPARKARLATLAARQAHIEQCPLFLVWVADVSRLDRVGAATGTEMAVTPFLETFLVAAIDAALAAQNAVIAAESLGLSTVYIGALRNQPEAVAAELELPPSAMGVFGLCIGYADPAVPAEVKPRLAPNAVLHHERYDAGADAAARAAYDQEMMAFSERNGLGPESWTDRVIKRAGRIRALGGRDRLVAQLRSLGFPLR